MVRPQKGSSKIRIRSIIWEESKKIGKATVELKKTKKEFSFVMIATRIFSEITTKNISQTSETKYDF